MGKVSIPEESVMDEKLCFEIPIYRCTEGRHSEEMAMKKASCLGPLGAVRNDAPQSYANAERHFDEKESYPWPYNEAIGWIQISVRGTEIKGELYFVKGKRVTRGMRKRFQWADGVFEIDVYPNDSSAKIYDAIAEQLDGFRREKRYRKWHLDDRAFRNAGRFVDWRRLVGFHSGNFGAPNNDVHTSKAEG